MYSSDFRTAKTASNRRLLDEPTSAPNHLVSIYRLSDLDVYNTMTYLVRICFSFLCE